MKFARWLFRIAGVYGLLVLPPMYFMEERIGQEQPPAITHPEFFYGFIGVAVAWQVAFLVIAHDPVRFRPLMLPAILEKTSFGLAVWLLWDPRQRVSEQVLYFGLIDLCWGVLFLIAWLRCGPRSTAGGNA